MIAFVRRGGPGHALPQSLAGLFVHAHDDELMLFACARASTRAATSLPAFSSALSGRILCLLRLWGGLSDFARRHGRGQKNSVTPDHRRRKASALNRDLPLNIFRIAEFDWRGGPGHAVKERPAPLRPMGGIRTGGADGQNNRCQRDQRQQSADSGQSFRHYGNLRLQARYSASFATRRQEALSVSIHNAKEPAIYR